MADEINFTIETPDMPTMRVSLSHEGLSGITIYADSQAERCTALRALLNASDEIQELEQAARRALA